MLLDNIENFGLMFISAIVMGIGFRIGNEIYQAAKLKQLNYQADKLIKAEEEGLKKLQKAPVDVEVI
jgi:hypothetical protein